MNRTILKLAASALIIGTMGAATATEVTPEMLKAAEQAAHSAMAHRNGWRVMRRMPRAASASALCPTEVGLRWLKAPT